MHRIILLVGLLAALGCKGTYNPLTAYGPTQVPPPPTGAAARKDPYYQRAQAPANPATPPPTGQLTRTYINSDQYRAATTVADARGAAGFTTSTPPVAPPAGQAVPSQPGPTFSSPPPTNTSGVGAPAASSSTGLDWQSAEPQYSAPAADPAQAGLPRPTFGP